MLPDLRAVAHARDCPVCGRFESGEREALDDLFGASLDAFGETRTRLAAGLEAAGHKAGARPRARRTQDDCERRRERALTTLDTRNLA